MDLFYLPNTTYLSRKIAFDLIICTKHLKVTCAVIAFCPLEFFYFDFQLLKLL